MIKKERNGFRFRNYKQNGLKKCRKCRRKKLNWKSFKNKHV